MSVNTAVPKRWRENLLNCRTCKRTLVKFVTEYILNSINTYLQPHQKLYIAGGFDGLLSDTVWYVCRDGQRQPAPRYTCNGEEADTRVWLHIRHTKHTQVLLMSPDTDVYHIGLALSMNNKHVFVQISQINSREVRYLDLKALTCALTHDPDLSSVPSGILPQVIQYVFVCSGCDYISFLVSLTRQHFCGIFFNMPHS